MNHDKVGQFWDLQSETKYFLPVADVAVCFFKKQSNQHNKKYTYNPKTKVSIFQWP